ncbi:hypothetical protein PoB_002937500 [Plakobranchus ocellatus]|uniref:Uncharacterized protein n=1 Tax=Plakobranchus ocellatus TaxID=259542 RepID=A0AAV4A666_9GAST|nr:hypothetical protein PoB_002937500 [Plakobranchus ocellatus]
MDFGGEGIGRRGGRWRTLGFLHRGWGAGFGRKWGLEGEGEHATGEAEALSFSDNNSDANELDLTSLQSVAMTFLSNQVETAFVDEELTPTSEATAVLDDVHGFYQAKDGNV